MVLCNPFWTTRESPSGISNVKPKLTSPVAHLLQDLVNIDLVALHGLLGLLGALRSLLHHLLGRRSLGGRGLHSLLSNLGSHFVQICIVYEELLC